MGSVNPLLGIVGELSASVGVLGWYHRQVPWAVEGIDVERDAAHLRAVHERMPAAIRL